MKYTCFAVLLLFSASLVAEPGCMKNAKSEEEINICQHAEASRLLSQLKNLEEEIRGRFSGIQLERFNQAQQLWQQMTNTDCEIEGDFYEGAPIYPAIQAQCLRNHYQRRIEDIGNYRCPEYSLSTGCDKFATPR